METDFLVQMASHEIRLSMFDVLERDEEEGEGETETENEED